MTRSAPVGANADAEKARTFRSHLGLDLRGPIPDLLHVVENSAGLAVSVIHLPEGVSGAYALEDEQGFAFLNMDIPVVRQRFTLAHELAHHVFSDSAIVDSEANVFGSPASPHERRANTFAAEFLIPLQAVHAWMDARGSSEADERLIIELAAFFRVSAKVALIRLELTRHLDSNSSLGKRLNHWVDAGEHLRYGQRLGVEEAPDSLSAIKKERKPRAPAKMWEYAVIGYERGLLTADRIAQALHMTAADVRAELERLGVSPPEDEPDY